MATAALLGTTVSCCGHCGERRRSREMEMEERGVMGECWRLSWSMAARRGLTERADGDAWPPRGTRVLNRSAL